MNTKVKGNLYILLTAILWSTGGILIKYVPGNAIAINGARSLIAFLFFVIYRKSFRIRINKYVILAALSLTLTNNLYVLSNKLTTAANAIVLQYTAPIFVLIWSCIYYKKRPQKQQIITVMLAFIGIALFFCDQLEGGYLLGNILAIISGVTFSGVFFINSLPKSSSEDASMLAFILSFAVSLPFLSGAALWDMKACLALLGLGVFQVGLAYAIFAKGARMTDPVSSSLIGLLEAMLNPLWVFLFYGETMGRFALIGAAIIIFAVIRNTLYKEDDITSERNKSQVLTNENE